VASGGKVNDDGKVSGGKTSGDGDGKGGAEQRPPSGTIAVDSPAVRARCEGNLPLGERIRVLLVKADPVRRSVAFEMVR
jgi:hypothetical protein